MIYMAPDYLLKYSDTLAEVITLAKLDKYSDDFIEESIAHSPIFRSFESSDVSDLAFHDTMFIYRKIFFDSRAYVDEIPLFNPYYWIGEMYMHLFFKFHLTFEALFSYFPISLMEKQYYLYHEMNPVHFEEYAKGILKQSPLSIFMKKRKLDCVELSIRTGISLSTIRSLKSKARDIKKVQFQIIEKLAIELKVDPRSLLDEITIITDQPY